MTLIIVPLVNNVSQVTLHSKSRRPIANSFYSGHDDHRNNAVLITLSFNNRINQSQRVQDIGNIRNLNSMVTKTVRGNTSNSKPSTQRELPLDHHGTTPLPEKTGFTSRAGIALSLVRNARDNRTRHVNGTPLVSFNVTNLTSNVNDTPATRLVRGNFAPILNRRFKVNRANECKRV